MNKTWAVRAWLFLCVAAPSAANAQPSNNCEKIKETSTAELTIQSAENIAAGKLKLPAGPFGPVDTSRLPEFCRVQGSIHPTSDSHISFELWMPAANWNNRYLQLGNGGFAGRIDTSSLAVELAQGYAAAATDDGHQGGAADGSWALGHPEKIKDFGYRAVHETNQAATKLIAAYYGSPAKYAYFNGCSEGGREALMEAQRYPRDFNGIIAGSPPHLWTKLMAAFTWNAQALNGAESFVPEARRKTVEAAALAACPNPKGIDDKFIDNPLQCRFDPSSLLCKSGDPSDNCLTQPQIDALKKIYGGPKNSRTGRQIGPGYMPGAEAEPGFPGISLASYVFGAGPGASLQAAFSSTFYGAFVFDDPTWNFARLNFDSDITLAEQKVGAILNASNPDLSVFKAAGGKLLHYHGWYDGLAPLHSVEYYEQVEKKMGGAAATQSFYRLYMVPGMMHCGSGPGPNTFGNLLDFAPSRDPQHNIVLAMEQWVENGIAPDILIATKRVDDSPAKPVVATRPLCAFPATAEWNQTGDPNQAANWKCVVQK
jgi:feruloyl esterase